VAAERSPYVPNYNRGRKAVPCGLMVIPYGLCYASARDRWWYWLPDRHVAPGLHYACPCLVGYLFCGVSGVWHLAKNVFATIFDVCPLVALALGRK